MLAVFEGATANTDLAELAATMTAQRARTASWLVERIAALGPLRHGLTSDEAVDTVWLLMDPAVFDRLTRQRRWPVERYQHWFADSVSRLLVDGPTPPPKRKPTRSRR